MPVGDFDVKLLCSLDDIFPLLGADIMGNLCCVFLVLHQQKFEIWYVVNDEFKETVGHEVPCVLVGAISDAGHQELSLETSPDPVVNSLGFPPAALGELGVPVGLMPDEPLCSLLDDPGFDEGRHHLELY